ncbi:MAG: hypothetical protein E6276_10050 [Clostridiales bacterium]|nr:hypothetical protein [Clostridiales bacterium]
MKNLSIFTVENLALSTVEDFGDYDVVGLTFQKDGDQESFSVEVRDETLRQGLQEDEYFLDDEKVLKELINLAEEQGRLEEE